MAIEIERKFLLRNDAWRAQAQRSVRMVQAYLGGERCSVRVRIEGTVARMNVKSLELGRRRLEFEFELPLADAEGLLEAFCPERVEKTRHYVPHAGRTWEIDEFDGPNRGLVLAEIELEHEDEEFPRPPWLGAEVTHEARYYNVSLATRPYSRWGGA